jgi:2-methylisocitrate lyase-like PEP mutase family enzyme
MPSPAEKRRTFRALHESGCFIIPNPFDVGSALYLQSLGFKALATTSSGAAWSAGYADRAMPLDLVLAHIRSIAAATDLPVNADFIAGFAEAPEAVAANVRRCVETGVAGLSIEDSRKDADAPLYDFDLAVERVRAARAAASDVDGDVVLVARTECYLTGHAEPLKEAIRRLTAFAEAGADCLYAPGVTKRDEIVSIVSAVTPKPVNVLMRGVEDMSLADLAALGVRRVSVGGVLARMAWAGVMKAAREMAGQERFASFVDAASGSELNGFFATCEVGGGQP